MRSTKNHFLFFFAIILLLTDIPFIKAQPNSEHLLKKTFAERCIILSPWYDSVTNGKDTLAYKNFISSVSEVAEKHLDDELKLESQLMLMQFYAWHRAEDQLFCMQEMNNFRKILLQENNMLMLAMLENIQGNYCWQQMGNYELGFQHYLAEFNIIKNLPPKDYPYKNLSLYQLGNCYYFFRDYPRCIFFMRQALKEPMNDERGPHFFFHASNTTGLSYRELNQLDSSDFYFQRALETADLYNRSDWRGLGNGNLGYNLFLRGQYNEAKPLLQSDVEASCARRDWGCASGAQMTLADISLEEGRPSEARKQLELAEKWVRLSGQYGRLETLFPLLSKLAMMEGRIEQAKMYLDSSLIVKDSLNRKLSALQLLRAEQKNDLEKHRAELIQIEDQKKIKTLQRNALIGVLGVLMLVAIYIYTLQRNRHIQRQLLMDAQLKEREQQLEISRMKLTEFTQSISEKTTMLEELQERLKGTDNSSLIAEMQQKTILTDDEWNHFRQLFEQVHTGWLQLLKEKLPGLTPAEVRFMVLAKLQFTTKDMASVLGISSHAVRTIWYRLRKKLNLPEEGSIEELVASI